MPVYLAGIFSLALVSGFAVYDYAVLGIKPHLEMPPQASPYHLLRAALALFCAALVVAAIVATRPRDRSPRALEAEAGTNRAIRWIAALSLATLGLFYVDADSFSRLSAEDGVVEWASAIMLFVACACLCASAVRGLRGRSAGRAVRVIAPSSLAFVCFVAGMEEISWMQRLLEFDTPAFLEAFNKQQEFNLHNLQTNLTENLYYCGAAGFLVVLPFLHDVSPIVPDDHPLAPFLPGRPVIFASAPLAAYNYDMWVVIPIQMAFYVTALVLLYYLIRAARSGGGALPTIVLVTVAVLLNQVSFLLWGDRLSWLWASTEYKELFIPIGLLFYAVSVLRRRPPEIGPV